METRNNQFTTEPSLIEELSDEELATAVGGCGWHWTKNCGTVVQGDLDLVDNGNTYEFTAYWYANDGAIESENFKLGLNEVANHGIYYDFCPTGSERFWAGQPVRGVRRR
jgi:hypothetical protein